MTKKQRGGYSDGASYVMENYGNGNQQYARVFDMNAGPTPFGNEIIKLSPPGPATVQALVKGGKRRTRKDKKKGKKSRKAHKGRKSRKSRKSRKGGKIYAF